MVSKGFLIHAQNTEDTDYIRQAYALAISIKLSQTEITNVSLVTNETVCDEYKKVFDKIVDIPWDTDTEASRYRAEHRWKLWYCTPYDETIVLDSDMLMLEDISQWWKYCENFDLKFCSRVVNYKLEVVEKDEYHRKAFIENKRLFGDLASDTRFTDPYLLTLANLHKVGSQKTLEQLLS